MVVIVVLLLILIMYIIIDKVLQNNSCFLCDADGENLQTLLNLKINNSEKELIQQIPELLGADFTVIIAKDDLICTQCIDNLNMIVKLEKELQKAKLIFFTNISKKYNFTLQDSDNNKIGDSIDEISCKINNEFSNTENVTPAVKRSLFHCVLCSFETDDRLKFNKHSRTHGNSNFVCLQCFFEFKDHNALKSHIKNHLMFNCRICGHPFANYFKLKHHLLKCSNQHKIYKCSICKIEYFNCTSLRDHISLKHKRKSIKINHREATVEKCNSTQNKNKTEDHLDASNTKINVNSNVNSVGKLKTCESNEKIDEDGYFTTDSKDSTEQNILKISKDNMEKSTMFNSSPLPILDNNNFNRKKLVQVSTISTYSPSDKIEETSIPIKNDTNKVSKDYKTVYICTICKFETDLDTEMKTHISSHTKDEHKCDKCKSVFKTQHSLELHARRHLPDSQPVKCNICQWECIDKLHLRSHKKNVHKVHLTCSVCKTVSNSKMQLQIHLQQHNGNRKFQCEICHMKFGREVLYKCHQEYSHRPDNKCKFCNKMLLNTKELRIHEKRHKRSLVNSELKCPYCEKCLKTKNGLRVHMAKHTGEYKYFCEVCGRGCMSLVVLKEHMGVHTKEERYVCDVCGKKFCFNSTYRVHRMWHDNPKPYICNDCGVKFAHTSLLAVHRRKVHTGERPYVCTGCNMSFTRSSSLKRHTRIHTGERPYVCIWCNKGFIERKIWAKHLANEHDDYTEINNKPKCEYKMVIRPQSDENINNEIQKDNNTTLIIPEVPTPVEQDQSQPDEMQEYIIIGNPNIENMIFYGLPAQVTENKTQLNSILIKPSNHVIEMKDDSQEQEIENPSYQIIQEDGDENQLKQDQENGEMQQEIQQHLLEGVDETSIVIKTDDGDMVIRNGQLVPLTNIL